MPLFFMEALEAHLQTLYLAANYATAEVNALGPQLADRLWDIPNRTREITGHGVCQGAVTAMPVVQT